MTWWQWLIMFVVIGAAGYLIAAVIVGRNE